LGKHQAARNPYLKLVMTSDSKINKF